MIKIEAFGHKVTRRQKASWPWLSVAVGSLPCWALGALALTATAPAAGAEGAHGRTAIACVNPSIGEPWQIVIDFDRSTVDSHPARISDTQISWSDPTKGRTYTLDRKSGNLTGVFASSTGGILFHDRCKLEN